MCPLPGSLILLCVCNGQLMTAVREFQCRQPCRTNTQPFIALIKCFSVYYTQLSNWSNTFYTMIFYQPYSALMSPTRDIIITNIKVVCDQRLCCDVHWDVKCWPQIDHCHSTRNHLSQSIVTENGCSLCVLLTILIFLYIFQFNIVYF